MTQELPVLLKQLKHVRVLVVGDVILDRYIAGATTRMSQEAPVPILQVDHQDVRPGGAACVASFLRGLGAEVSVAGVTGDDHAGNTLRTILAEDSISTDLLLTDRSRPTTQKDRFIGRAADRHGQQMLRVDYESTAPINCEFKRPLRHGLQEAIPAVDAVIVADYAKGVCSRLLLESVIPPARSAGISVLVDPGRGNPLEWYRGATVLKPNRLEAERESGRTVNTPEQALAAATELRSRGEVQSVVITLDQDGCVICDENAQTHLPTRSRSVYDITGAGDMFIAALAVALGSGLCLSDAAHLANSAAGLEVERVGTAPVTLDELKTPSARQRTPSTEPLITVPEAAGLAKLYRDRGDRVVLTNGCFDLLHPGHVQSLQEARAMGDVLIVAINSDRTVRSLKGPGRPVLSENDRALMLSALKCVGHVVVFDEDTPHNLLGDIRPDVLVKGGSYKLDEVVGHEVVTAYGGEVAVTKYVDGVSTSTLVSTIQDA